MRAIKHRRGTYYRIYKKVRGGKRHLRRLQDESNWAAPLAVDTLLGWQYYYEKLGLHPWHWHHRQPPKRVRQLAAQHLLTTFFAWQPALTALSEPVYAAVWLVGPEFAHSSEVTVGIRQSIERHQNILGEPDPAGPPLPAEYQELPGADKLTWQTHPREVGYDADDFPAGWPASLLHHPHYEHTYSDGRLFLIVQTGWVWVGQLAGATPR
ncbi:hypothetical protein [Hymenobacter perfusus]|uniref:Uncharacterized protein n=1 Tax=Hymenobacter perfusus TaxID=1236770 RepID=A0A428K426_9BACT|nr:hypothetical protein [Hymenobacter perfusus]RSK41185.1 hypothetical protein EI293_17320 [Hymenobacter perfusus]